MTDSDSGPAPRAADAIPSHVSSFITQGLEDIYGRFSPYAERHCHVDCLRAMEKFRTDVLDHLEFVHSQLRLRLSAAAPVNQLPADVLIHIFAAMDFADLVTATHVCYQWRKLGLETPELWATLTLDDMALQDSQLLLDRSKAAQLDLSFSPESRRFVSTTFNVAALKPYMHRLRHLSIRPRPCVASTPAPADGWVTWQAAPAVGWNASPPGERVSLLLPDVLHLQSLTIDWDWLAGLIHIDVSQDSGTIDQSGSVISSLVSGGTSNSRPDFSSLTEVSLLRGVGDFEFLRHCTQLRKLSLFVRDDASYVVIACIIRANPSLERLMLGFKHAIGIPAPPGLPAAWGHKLSLPRLQSIVFQSGESMNSFHWSAPQMLGSAISCASYLFLCFDCSDVPYIEIDVLTGLEDHAFYDDVLGQLQTVIVIDACYGRVLAHDLRGHTRRINYVYIDRLLRRSYLMLGSQVQSLRVYVHEWHGVSQLCSPEFLSLEELWLSGDRMDYGYLSPTALCPRLRLMTLEIGHSCHGSSGNDITDDGWLGVGVALALRRIFRGPMPPLQRLTIIAAFSLDLEETTWHCAPPFPETVVCHPSTESAESMGGSREASHYWDLASLPDFPSVPARPGPSVCIS